MPPSSALTMVRPFAGPVALLLLAGTVAAIGLRAPAGAQEGRPVPAPLVDEAAPATRGSETAVLAGGCFWGVQGVFQHVKGVTAAVSGYAGGGAADAHYTNVGTGRTGHAESVRVTFDPRVVSYGQLLQIYFAVAHDPTTLNRQGPDHGTQYRSAVFPADAEQARVAAAYKAQLDGAHVFDGPVVTTIEPGKAFFPAEGYHQDFLARNPRYPYIAINDMPKVEALQRLFPARFRAEPVLVADAPVAP